MLLTPALLNTLTAQAQVSPRLRQNYDLRDSADDQSQRMLNAIEPGTVLPIHRHRGSSETVVMLRGKGRWNYYDDNGNLTESFIVSADEDFWKVINTLEKMQDIHEVKVFDLYQGENLWDGKKSISVQIKIKWDGSLTTEGINKIMQDAIKRVEATGAKLRA